MQNQFFQSFLYEFYQTPKGCSLLLDEQLLIENALSKVFGYYLVQLGITCERNLVSSSRVSRKIITDAHLPETLDPALLNEFVQADIDYLPFQTDAIDAVVMPHTLESVEDPYHLLRQVDKMLVPEGHMLITGFNPLGCQIIRQRLGENREAFKQANLVKEQRVVDWLNVLGYDIEKISYSSLSCVTKEPETYKPSEFLMTLENWMDKIGIDLGNIYCVLAKKRVASPTPVGLNWRLANWQPIKKGRIIANSQAHQKTSVSKEMDQRNK